MKRAPPFGFEVVVDYKRIFRSWHIGAVKTVLISGERADSVAHGSVLLGVAEFHVLPVHLPYQSTDSVAMMSASRRFMSLLRRMTAARLMSRTRGRECCFFISVI